ncbi:MAG: ParA family protein [Hyphomonadaceae bacterium]|nr:ParA family protein [Clostridia bacterium]
MGKVIAITNQKGGVGKTTTAVNLSACLGARGKRVLVIDIDPQGNTSSGLGIDKRALTSSIYDVLINDVLMAEAIQKTAFENLWICPANVHLAGAELELIAMSTREYRLKNALACVRNSYDFVIIDCPPSLSLLTLNALTATDTALVPIQCEYYALEGLSQLTSTIKHIRKQLNTTLEIEGVLLTMFDARTNLSIQVVEEVKKFFPKKTYASVIPRNVRLSEAPSFGQPVIIYDAKSKGAESYFDLADEVIEGNEEGKEWQ